MLLMIWKGIRGGQCHSIYWYAKFDSKHKKDCGKNKEPSYLQYWDVNNLYELTIWQKMFLKNFQYVKKFSKFLESFIKKLMKKVIKQMFLNMMLNILKIYKIFPRISFLAWMNKNWKIGKACS